MHEELCPSASDDVRALAETSQGCSDAGARYLDHVERLGVIRDLSLRLHVAVCSRDLAQLLP